MFMDNIYYGFIVYDFAMKNIFLNVLYYAEFSIFIILKLYFSLLFVGWLIFVLLLES